MFARSSLAAPKKCQHPHKGKERCCHLERPLHHAVYQEEERFCNTHTKEYQCLCNTGTMAEKKI